MAAVAGLLDPFGPMRTLTDALPSALGAIGLVWTGYELNRNSPDLRLAVPCAHGWLIAGVASAAGFVMLLGPGLRF